MTRTNRARLLLQISCVGLLTAGCGRVGFGTVGSADAEPDLNATLVDECALGRDNCHANAVCIDTPPAFECACNSGFVGDGVNCRPGTVRMFDVRVASGLDDVEEFRDGTMLLDSTDLELMDDIGLGQPNQTVGIRFEGLPLSNVAQITSAYVQFAVLRTINQLAGIVEVRAQASGSAAIFSSTPGDITMRPVTSALVDWDPPLWPTAGEAGPAQRTPDLRAVIAEVVGRGDWSPGSPLVIVFTGSGTRYATTYESAPAAAPLLHLEYLQ